MASLGQAEEYEAVIVDSLTEQPLLYLPWSVIKWQRIRNEISVASVVVAQGDGGIECCGPIGGIFPWSQMLRIERNGGVVWDGPITGWSRPRSTRDLTIKAHDRAALIMKRLVAVHRSYVDTPPPEIIAELLLDAGIGVSSPAGYPNPYVISPGGLLTTPTEFATREYFVERLERVYDAVRELTENTYTGFYTCWTEDIITDELNIAATLGLAAHGLAPKLNEFTTIGLPGIDVDGLNMSTVVYAGGAGQGISGFPLIEANSGNLGIFSVSLLERAAAEARSATTSDLALIAGRGAAESLAPQVTLEQIQLSPLFGNEFMLADLSNLLPGCQFDLDFAETCAFQIPVSEYREASGVPGVAYVTSITRARLDQLDTTVGKTEGGGIVEEMLASYRPIISADISHISGALPSTPEESEAAGEAGDDPAEIEDVVDGGIPYKNLYPNRRY